ncbi:CoA-binding protein [bacterium]|nr:CoA-binding protein [bacterium]MBU1677115.1 CoA-binding protein [bacterium]
MHADGTPDDRVAAILRDMKRVAVVGISDKPERASHGITRFLVGLGVEVVGINPMLEEVLGVKVYPSLADVPGSLDVVDIFRRSETVPPVVDEAIAVGAGTVWMQEGVVNEDAARAARNAGLDVIMDRCIYKEWLRLLNG